MKKKPGRILPPDNIPPKEMAMTALTGLVLVIIIIGFTYWVVS